MTLMNTKASLAEQAALALQWAASGADPEAAGVAVAEALVGLDEPIHPLLPEAPSQGADECAQLRESLASSLLLSFVRLGAPEAIGACASQLSRRGAGPAQALLLAALPQLSKLGAHAALASCMRAGGPLAWGAQGWGAIFDHGAGAALTHPEVDAFFDEALAHSAAQTYRNTLEGARFRLLDELPRSALSCVEPACRQAIAKNIRAAMDPHVAVAALTLLSRQARLLDDEAAPAHDNAMFFQNQALSVLLEMKDPCQAASSAATWGLCDFWDRADFREVDALGFFDACFEYNSPRLRHPPALWLAWRNASAFLSPSRLEHLAGLRLNRIDCLLLAGRAQDVERAGAAGERFLGADRVLQSFGPSWGLDEADHLLVASLLAGPAAPSHGAPRL